MTSVASNKKQTEYPTKEQNDHSVGSNFTDGTVGHSYVRIRPPHLRTEGAEMINQLYMTRTKVNDRIGELGDMLQQLDWRRWHIESEIARMKSSLKRIEEHQRRINQEMADLAYLRDTINVE